MNPLDWNRQHQVAGIAFCAIGAIVGNFFSPGWTPHSDSCLRIPFPGCGPIQELFSCFGCRTSIFMGSGQLSTHAPRHWHFTVYNYRGADLRPRPQSPHLHSPLVTGLVAVQDGRMVDSG